MFGKFNFLCSFHIWVSFLKLYGFNDYYKFWYLACTQLTCFCIICPVFVVLEKIILGVIRKWRSEAAQNFEFYLSDWHFSLTLFTALLISNSASDGDKTPPISPGGKKSRSSPAFKVSISWTTDLAVCNYNYSEQTLGQWLLVTFITTSFTHVWLWQSIHFWL